MNRVQKKIAILAICFASGFPGYPACAANTSTNESNVQTLEQIANELDRLHDQLIEAMLAGNDRQASFLLERITFLEDPVRGFASAGGLGSTRVK